jgi:hypothetical protein
MILRSDQVKRIPAHEDYKAFTEAIALQAICSFARGLSGEFAKYSQEPQEQRYRLIFDCRDSELASLSLRPRGTRGRRRPKAG